MKCPIHVRFMQIAIDVPFPELLKWLRQAFKPVQRGWKGELYCGDCEGNLLGRTLGCRRFIFCPGKNHGRLRGVVGERPGNT